MYSLHLGSGVSEITADDFNGDTRLHDVTVSEGSDAFQSVDGVLFTADGKTLVYYSMNRQDSAYAVPADCETIASDAFRNNSVLTSVTLSASVQTIGEYAFAGCGRLTEITGSGLTDIREGAFFGCQSLQNVNIGDRITSLGAFAFVSNASLKTLTLPYGLTLNPDLVYFDAQAGLTLVGKVGSSVQSYAEAWNIVFVDPDAEAVTSISLSSTELMMDRGTTSVLTATVLPANAALGTGITWYSDNTSIVTVANGTLYAVGNGTATITAQSGNGCTANCRVTVSTTLRSVRIDLIPDLTAGETVQLNVSTVPALSDVDIIWSSSDEYVAAVDEHGLLTAVAVGSATVTASTSSGVTDSIPVTVYTPVSSVSISAPDTEMYAIPGCNTMQLALSVEPSTATYTDVYWNSENRNVLDVDENGLVTAYHAGTATVTAVSKDPGAAEATFVITVNCYDISSGTVNSELQKVYDGQTAELDGSSITVNGYDLGCDYFGLSWNDLQADAGSYEFTISGDNRRTTGEFTGTFTILPAIPEITFAEMDTLSQEDIQDRSFFTLDMDWLEYTVAYGLIHEDGSLEAVDEPAVNGRYRVTVSISATSNTQETTAVHTYKIFLFNEVHIDSAITLPTSVTGRLPVGYDVMEGDDAELLFYTSDDSIVDITMDGLLTTLAAGQATITVELNDGSAYAACEVTVADFEEKLQMPSALTEIEEEAFSGNAAVQYIKLGDHVTSIGSRAFADMSGLMAVDAPEGLTGIAADAFSGSSPVVICSSGSAAEAYAIEHGLQYLTK